MTRIRRLRQLFNVFLLTAVLIVATAIGNISHASAGTGALNEKSNVKGESRDINGSYHTLQAATQDARNKIEDERKDASSSKSTRRSSQPEKAVKNISKNTKNALQRAAESIK